MKRILKVKTSRTTRLSAYIGIMLLILLILYGKAMLKREQDNLIYLLTKDTYQIYMPLGNFEDGEKNESTFLENVLLMNFPFFKFLIEDNQVQLATQDADTYEKILLYEGMDENRKDSIGEEMSPSIVITQDMENENAKMIESGPFVKQTEKQQSYDMDDLMDYEYLTKKFYAVDSTTSVSNTQINPKVMLAYDCGVDKGGDEPKILIYHTHSQEAFADSVEGDSTTTVVGAGEYLTELLRDVYGYNVMHHTGEYDVENRDLAYSLAAPALEELLKENPSIEVVIDLHRDGISENQHLVTYINGKPCARFMFFNGMSYTKSKGNIEYLENPYIEDNLAFSFQLQLAANEYYPDLARRIYIKGYRYNMQYIPKSLLVELGAQTNTVAEIRNACEPLAHILDLVLSGTANS